MVELLTFSFGFVIGALIAAVHLNLVELWERYVRSNSK